MSSLHLWLFAAVTKVINNNQATVVKSSIHMAVLLWYILGYTDYQTSIACHCTASGE